MVGSFLIGAITGFFVRYTGLAPELRLFLATGIIGGFTTFSTFALEIVLLHERGATLAAVGYALGVGHAGCRSADAGPLRHTVNKGAGSLGSLVRGPVKAGSSSTWVKRLVFIASHLWIGQ